MPRLTIFVRRHLGRLAGLTAGLLTGLLLTGCTAKPTPVDFTVQRPEIDLHERLAERDADLFAWLNDMPVISGRGRSGLVGPGPIEVWIHDSPAKGELFWRDLDGGRREFVYFWLPKMESRHVGRTVLDTLGPPGEALLEWLRRRRATARDSAPFNVDDLDALRGESLPGLGTRSGRLIYLFGSLDGPQRLERLTMEAFRHRGDDVVFIEDPRSVRDLGPHLHGTDRRTLPLWSTDADRVLREILGPADDVTDDDCRLYYKALLTTLSIVSVDTKIATSMSAFDAIAEHVESRRAAPPRSRVFIGASYGATVGPALIANSTRPFDAVVLIAGGVDLLPVGSSLIDRIPIVDGPCVPPEFSLQDRADIRRAYLDLVQLDPFHWAERVTPPTLVIEPVFDRVFASNSRRLLQDRLPNAEVWHHLSGHFGIFVFGLDMTRVADWVDARELERPYDNS